MYLIRIVREFNSEIVSVLLKNIKSSFTKIVHKMRSINANFRTYLIAIVYCNNEGAIIFCVNCS